MKGAVAKTAPFRIKNPKVENACLMVLLQLMEEVLPVSERYR